MGEQGATSPKRLYEVILDEATLPQLATTGGVAEQVVVVVDPLIEDLIGSVLTAGA